MLTAGVIAALSLSGVSAAWAGQQDGVAGQTGDATASATITVDTSSGGRIFDGIGAISGGGATSRLLLDYPEDERNEVLDYLFKPGYGASLQLLKVEIGGDTNTTDGSESSHAHTRGDVNCDSGYEWWLMKEAVERNPEITLGALAWGAPGWLGDGEYFSNDTIEYFIDWLDCAQGHGLTIDNMGVRNEREYESAWVKEYRAALDAAGYEDVRIIASDEAARKGEWSIAVDMANDPELYDAVDLLGNHYSNGKSSPTAQALDKPLWISEGGPWSGEWAAGGSARSIPSLLNHAYIEGRVTGVEIWNLLTAYYAGLSISDAGLMRSNTPWSGAYQVQSAIWAVAQTTQFTEPGWQYLDASSGYFDAAAPAQGSFVTLRSTESDDWSTIIENIGTSEPRTITLAVADGLKSGDLHVWQTTENDWFSQQADLVPGPDGMYTLTIPANSSVTVTTTTGQGRGDAVGQPESAFPFPYHDSLSDGGQSGQTPYFSQMEGAYEERACEGGREGTCLTQVSEQPAIGWAPWKKPAGVLGDLDWSNYSTTVEAYVPAGGSAQILGRVSNDAMQPVPNGYGLTLAADGTWSIGRGVVGGKSWLELATGSVSGLGEGWHELSLSFAGDVVSAEIDGTRVTDVTDSTWVSGMVGLSGDYSATQFANLAVEPLEPIATIDGSDAAAVYEGDGWQHCATSGVSQEGCSGFTPKQVEAATSGTVSGSNHDGDAVNVTFDGTQATLVGVTGPRGGDALVSIDGSEPIALSFDQDGRGGELVWRSPVLIDGSHTLRLEVDSDVNGNLGWIGLDRVEVVRGLDGPSSVDDQSDGIGAGQLDYRGTGWVSCPGCINRTGLYHSSVTSTSVAGDSVSFRFTGSSVELYGLRATKGGLATVVIDGTEVGVVDFYGKVRIGNLLIWSSPALTPGEHTLTVIATGTGSEQASGVDIDIDRMLVRP
jgi:O-glycosyl hydrolase